MQISIIIANLNEASELKKTLESISTQKNIIYEVIVCDGGSSDNSVGICQQYPNVQVHSEPDEGIADAFNKGLLRANGEYIYFLGTGDVLLGPYALSKMLERTEGAELICGKIQRTDPSGSKNLWVAPKNMPKNFDHQTLRYRMSLPHQGLLTHKDFFARFGLFDKSCRFAMDYELLLRAYHAFPRVILKDMVVATWRGGGVGMGNQVAILKEYRRIRKLHKIAPGWYLDWRYFIERIKLQVKQLLSKVGAYAF